MRSRCRSTPCDRYTRTAATATIQTRETGISTFHPIFMNWSYRSRGNVPRSQMKTNTKTRTLPKNQTTGIQPLLAADQSEIGHGARQPPRNSVVARAETVTRLTYSARKNSANFSELYSVWNPPSNG